MAKRDVENFLSMDIKKLKRQLYTPLDALLPLLRLQGPPIFLKLPRLCAADLGDQVAR